MIFRPFLLGFHRTTSSEVVQKASPHSSSPSKSSKGVIVVDDDGDDEKSSKLLERNSSAKIAAMAERRAARGLEMQHQLNQAHEDLKKMRDQLAASDEEKSRLYDELAEMKKVAEDATLKLSEALSAQKRAEDGWELEKVQAKELEQASIGSAEKREQAWQFELEAIQRQHVMVVDALTSTEHELMYVNKELSSVIKARDEAIKEDRDAKALAEANLKRANDLSTELDSMRRPLGLPVSSNSNAELETLKDNGSSSCVQVNPMIESERQEFENMKREFENMKDMDSQLAEREALIENLKLEISDAKESEMQMADSLSKSKARIEMFEQEINKAKQSEAKMLESLISQTKKLEETKISLEEAKFEIASLHDNVRTLEVSVGRSSKDLNASRRSLEMAKQDKRSVKETIETLKFDIQTAKEDLCHAKEREELALSDSRSLAEEIGVLKNELKLVSEAEEKGRKAMDDLALALKEVTEEANQAKEKLMSTELELENAKMEIENSKLILKRTEVSFQALLDESRREVEHAKGIAERLRIEAEESNDDWKSKEAGFVQCMKDENGVLTKTLIKAEGIAKKAREENLKLRGILKQEVNEAAAAKEAADIARTEYSQLRHDLSYIGTTLESILYENGQLKVNDAATLEKVKELKSLPSLTVNREPKHSKKPSTPSEEHKNSKKTAKFQLAPLKKQRSLDVEFENPIILNGSNNDDSEPDILEGSIFNMVEGEDDESPSDRIRSHRKALSSVFLGEIDMLNSDVFNPHFDDMEGDRCPARHRKKKALLYRFGDLLRRRTYIRCISYEA